jgi:DNA-binding response OmpR family regulator
MDTILVVDHDRANQKVLRLLFEPEGYLVQAASDGQSGLAAFRRSRPALVVLDLKLPRVPGRDVCREIRKQVPSLPILILTAIADETEKVLLLELGADDYVTKPFSPSELLARVRALIRRRHDQQAHRCIRFDDICVDLLEMKVTRAGEPIYLTGRELRIVEQLLRAPGHVVPRQELLNRPGYHQRRLVSNAVKTHISNVRRKLEKHPKKPSHFVTVHGVGYKFVR